jgi:hypothetical protein
MKKQSWKWNKVFRLLVTDIMASSVKFPILFGKMLHCVDVWFAFCMAIVGDFNLHWEQKITVYNDDL